MLTKEIRQRIGHIMTLAQIRPIYPKLHFPHIPDKANITIFRRLNVDYSALDFSDSQGEELIFLVDQIVDNVYILEFKTTKAYDIMCTFLPLVTDHSLTSTEATAIIVAIKIKFLEICNDNIHHKVRRYCYADNHAIDDSDIIDITRIALFLTYGPEEEVSSVLRDIVELNLQYTNR